MANRRITARGSLGSLTAAFTQGCKEVQGDKFSLIRSWEHWADALVWALNHRYANGGWADQRAKVCGDFPHAGEADREAA